MAVYAGDGGIGKKVVSSEVVFQRSKTKKTTTLTDQITFNYYQYSVSADTKVIFSPAGLLYDGANWTFLSNQTDYYTTSSNWTADGKRDFFIYADASQNRSIKGNSWYNLTRTEWMYLYKDRTSGAVVNGVTNARFVKVKLDFLSGTPNDRGLLLFPDGFTWPEAISGSQSRFTSSYVNTLKSGFFTIYSDEFTALEEAGCVLLLAPRGCRSNTGTWSRTLIDGGYTYEYGAYWTSTDHEALQFYGNGLGMASTYSINTSFPVRLVRNAPSE